MTETAGEVKTWYARGYLSGAIILGDGRAFDGALVNEQTGETFPMHVDEHTETRAANAPTRTAHQRVEFSVVATDHDARQKAEEVLDSIADAVSLATMRRVSATVGPLQSAPFEAEGDEIRVIAPMRRMHGSFDGRGLSMEVVGYVGQRLARSDDATARATRWLRRSYNSIDVVEEYAAAAIGVEAIGMNLPSPPPEWLNALRARNGAKPGGAAKKHERLRYFAAATCGMTEEHWKEIWDRRNDLFHGDVAEDAVGIRHLASALGELRRVLVRAILTVLHIPPGTLPGAEGPQLTIPDMTLIMRGVKFQDVPPETPD